MDDHILKSEEIIIYRQKKRLRNIFFGAYNQQDGCVSSLYNICNDPRFNHQSGIKGGILEQDCSNLMSIFFKKFKT